jgi:hypothetical protein
VQQRRIPLRIPAPKSAHHLHRPTSSPGRAEEDARWHLYSQTTWSTRHAPRRREHHSARAKAGLGGESAPKLLWPPRRPGVEQLGIAVSGVCGRSEGRAHDRHGRLHPLIQEFDAPGTRRRDRGASESTCSVSAAALAPVLTLAGVDKRNCTGAGPNERNCGCAADSRAARYCQAVLADTRRSIRAKLLPHGR